MTLSVLIERCHVLLRPEDVGDGRPAVIEERVTLSCGCRSYIGRPASAAGPALSAYVWPCHEHNLIAFQEALLKSLKDHPTALLSERVAQLMVEYPG